MYKPAWVPEQNIVKEHDVFMPSCGVIAIPEGPNNQETADAVIHTLHTDNLPDSLCMSCLICVCPVRMGVARAPRAAAFWGAKATALLVAQTHRSIHPLATFLDPIII